MNFMKNLALTLCLFFLIGCLKFGANQQDLHAYNLNDVTMDESTYPVVIIGGGPAGLTASIYTAQANLKTVLLGGQEPGGAITMSHSVRNWPGEINITGRELAEKIEKQAKGNGVTILNKVVTAVDFAKWPYQITTKDLASEKTEIIKALSCIIATGTTPNYLGIPGEEKYWGKGITGCAICDGPLYKDKKVIVVGGGDAAMTEANYLSNIAKEVIVVVRRDVLRAKEKRGIEELKEKSNVKILYNTELKEIIGDSNKITHVIAFDSANNKKIQINVDGIFLAIGSTPNSKIFENQLDLTPKGFIVKTEGQQTSKDGIYCAGDISDPEYKQAISAAGDGCKAALETQKFLDEIGYEVEKIPTKNQALIEKPVKKSPVVKTYDAKPLEITTSAQYQEFVKNSEIPVVVDIYATWCGPCQRMHPIFDQLAKEFQGVVRFVKININTAKTLSSETRASSIPTFLFFNNGQKISTTVGAKSVTDLKNLINNIFKLNN